MDDSIAVTISSLRVVLSATAKLRPFDSSLISFSERGYDDRLTTV